MPLWPNSTDPPRSQDRIIICWFAVSKLTKLLACEKSEYNVRWDKTPRGSVSGERNDGAAGLGSHSKTKDTVDRVSFWRSPSGSERSFYLFLN